MVGQTTLCCSGLWCDCLCRRAPALSIDEVEAQMRAAGGGGADPGARLLPKSMRQQMQESAAAAAAEKQLQEEVVVSGPPGLWLAPAAAVGWEFHSPGGKAKAVVCWLDKQQQTNTVAAGEWLRGALLQSLWRSRPRSCALLLRPVLGSRFPAFFPAAPI
jgi:hypothetical protein